MPRPGCTAVMQSGDWESPLSRMPTDTVQYCNCATEEVTEGCTLYTLDHTGTDEDGILGFLSFDLLCFVSIMVCDVRPSMILE